VTGKAPGLYNTCTTYRKRFSSRIIGGRREEITFDHGQISTSLFPPLPPSVASPYWSVAMSVICYQSIQSSDFFQAE